MVMPWFSKSRYGAPKLLWWIEGCGTVLKIEMETPDSASMTSLVSTPAISTCMR